MALKIDKLQLEIEIMNDSAMQNLKKQEEAIRGAKNELGKLTKGTKEYTDQKNKIKLLEAEYQEMASKIKISDMPLSMLVKRQKELNAAIANMRPSSEWYAKYRDELNQTKQRIAELRGTAKDTGLSIGKVADGFNKYASLFAGAAASIAGVTLTARKCVDNFAQMEEAESQVVKYTGMTKKEVEDLNEDFKKMDTRTSREQLNALAGDAGKLGITGKKNIEDFVEAGNQINIALGEDLGEDAIKNIGKLAMMFGEDKSMGSLKKAMLATGSAINYIGQSSSASEPYLAEFLGQIGSVGHQANMTQAQLLGYSSVLDQNKVDCAVASTAFQQLTLKMFQDPSKYAKIAGKDIKEFGDLLKTNANEALLQFLTGLSKFGDLTESAPVIKSLGLDGQKAAQVLTALAGNISNVRTEQEKATKAYAEGTSITKEYDVQNNTVQAGLEKAKKHFQDITIELGQKLEPAMKHAISSTSAMIRIGLSIINFITRHSAAIITLVAVMGTYLIAAKLNVLWTTKMKVALVEMFTMQKLATAWTKIYTAANIVCSGMVALFTGKLKLAKEAMIAFNVVTKLNPFGLILTAITAVVAAIILFKKRTQETTELTKTANKIHQDTIDKYSEEASKVRVLSAIVHNSNIPYQERMNALNKLKAIVPGYHASLTKEGTLVNDNTKAIENYLATFKKKILMEAAEDALREAYKKKINAEVRNERVKTIKGIFDSGLNKELHKEDKSNNMILSYLHLKEKYQKEEELRNSQIKEQDSTIKYLEAFTGKSASSYYKVAPKTSVTTKKGGTGGGGDTNITKPGKTGNTSKKDTNYTAYQTDSKNLEASHIEEMNTLKKNAAEKEQTEAQYNLESIEQNEEYLKQKLALQQKYAETEKDPKTKAEMLRTAAETNSQLLDLTKQKGEAQLKELQEDRDTQLQQVEEIYTDEKLALAKSLEDGTYSQEEYNDRMEVLELALKDSKVGILHEYSEDLKDTQISDNNTKKKALQDAEQAEKSANIDASTAHAKYTESMQQKEKDNQEKILEIKEKYGIDTTKERYQQELALLDDLHAKGILSEQVYQAAVQALDKKTAEKKKLSAKEVAQAVSQIAGELSSAVSGLAEAETIASDAKYDKQIAAAKKAGKDTTKLEEQKEAAQNKIKKKYADMQFAASVLQIGATTAVTAMEAYKAMAGIYVVGPALGAAAAAAAVLAGAAQIKVAKANRDAAKGLYSGGYEEEYSEGYTPSINPTDVAGVIPVHGGEFVANHEAVENPHVNKFLRIINLAQKNGTIRMLNTTGILEQAKLGGGYYSGGYNSKAESAATTTDTSVSSVFANDYKMQILQQLRIIAEKKLTLSLTDVRDGINEIETYETNASR